MTSGMDPQTDTDFLAREAYCEWEHLATRQRIQDRFGSHPQPWFRWCFDRFQASTGPSREQARVLDVGSGSGELWDQNREHLPALWEIHLADRSPGMLSTARQRLAGLRQVASTVELDAQNLPFTSEIFGIVIALGLLDHLQDRSDTLDQIRRVLKKGGWLYASAGSQAHLQEIETLIRPFLTDEVDLGGNPDRFGAENGVQILQESFIRVQRIPYRAEMRFQRVIPILAYILSEAALRRALTDESCRELKKSLERLLADQGSIQVTLDKALFLAQKI